MYLRPPLLYPTTQCFTERDTLKSGESKVRSSRESLTNQRIWRSLGSHWESTPFRDYPDWWEGGGVSQNYNPPLRTDPKCFHINELWDNCMTFKSPTNIKALAQCLHCGHSVYNGGDCLRMTDYEIRSVYLSRGITVQSAMTQFSHSSVYLSAGLNPLDFGQNDNPACRGEPLLRNT